ncbi:MAG: SDR family oxidoreductase [Anaerolineae bacterium]
MKLLITGSSGLLGLNLALQAAANHEVIGVDRNQLRGVPFQLICTDLLTAGIVDHLLDQTHPQAVIHCAALADLEACEANPELARRLNTELPAQFAEACRRRGVAFLHISTDAVFDGQKDGFYTEDDPPHPLSVYARTKVDSERAVLEVYPQAIVARVNFYGWSLRGTRSLAEFFISNLSQNKIINGFTDVYFCPMFVNDLGTTLLKMLEKHLSGLYHVVGPQAMSKYQFGAEIARKFGLPEANIVPKSIHASDLTAPRSQNLCLSTAKVSTALGEPLPSFSTGLDRFYAQYQQGYPQKLRSYAQVS